MPAVQTRVLVTALVVLALVAAAVALVGCATRLPDTPAGITGTVMSLVPGDERPVEGGAQPAGAASDKAQVAINPGTMFFDSSGNPTKASGITVGTKVRVWFDGAVAESYPVQGSAQAVQILGK
jgi:hypothetical protein